MVKSVSEISSTISTNQVISLCRRICFRTHLRNVQVVFGLCLLDGECLILTIKFLLPCVTTCTVYTAAYCLVPFLPSQMQTEQWSLLPIPSEKKWAWNCLCLMWDSSVVFWALVKPFAMHFWVASLGIKGGHLNSETVFFFLFHSYKKPPSLEHVSSPALHLPCGLLIKPFPPGHSTHLGTCHSARITDTELLSPQGSTVPS